MNADSKTQLRAYYAEIRKSIRNKEVLEKALCEYILQSDLYKNAEAVFSYAGIKSEASVDMVTEAALKDGKKVALPLCLDKTGNMDFYYIKSLDDIKEGMYNIREPDVNICEKANYDVNTICLVPGLCFDMEGLRLGYGKGYYDRFLLNFNGISIGVAFENCLTEKLVKNKFDQRVNYLITDKKIYNFI